MVVPASPSPPSFRAAVWHVADLREDGLLVVVQLG